MNFGYSDYATIFLNKVPVFSGISSYRSRNMAYGGWISYNDAVYLNLKRGDNELLVVIGEDFGGDGVRNNVICLPVGFTSIKIKWLCRTINQKN